MDIQAGMVELKAGGVIQRGTKSNNNGSSVLFLKTNGKRKYLFARKLNQSSGEIVESPAFFDWDDMAATDWRVIN